MKINGEQYAQILSLISNGNVASSDRDDALKYAMMANYRKIEEAQGKIYASQAALAEQVGNLQDTLEGFGGEADNHREAISSWISGLETKINSLQAALLHSDFKRGKRKGRK